jgi:hypothetical protein
MRDVPKPTVPIPNDQYAALAGNRDVMEVANLEETRMILHGLVDSITSLAYFNTVQPSSTALFCRG